MKRLEQFVKIKSGATEKEWQQFKAMIYSRSVKAGEDLFRQGEESELIAFVSTGLVYTYYSTLEGEIKVKKFSWEGRVASPYSTLLSGTKLCYFSAQALEDSELLCLNYSDLQKLYNQNTSGIWQKLGRVIAEESLIERERREYETLCMSLRERYERFLKRHQEILDRAPQYLIAAYLGVNAASLSRLRARIGKKLT